MTSKSDLAYFGYLVVCIFIVLGCSPKLENRSWQNYLGDKSVSHYSPLNQIDTTNVTGLKLAWEYHTGDLDPDNHTMIECNPLIIGDHMFGTSPRLKLFCIDATTGVQNWIFDPFSGSSPTSVHVNRGITYLDDGSDGRIFYAVGNFIYCVNAKNGSLITDFGDNGKVDMRQRLDRDVKNAYMISSTPGIIFKDLLIMGSRVAQLDTATVAAPGHIRAYNVFTGKQEWIFHTIPHPGEFGYDTWENKDAWKSFGGANNWGGMSVDEKRGIVYVSTTPPIPTFYGGLRKGMNLFANSVVALNASDGKYIWHFQTVHHDIWDRDLPAAPNLVTLNMEGKKIDAVAQITKSGYVFVLDRETGKPIFPVDEAPQPSSPVLDGEEPWPTQPIPRLPKPFARQHFTDADINPYISDSSKAEISERLANMDRGDLYKPFQEGERVVFPGFAGGAQWGGASFDPTTGFLYINSSDAPWTIKIERKKTKSNESLSGQFIATDYKSFDSKEGYPAVKPPWGTLSAIDLNTGENVWEIPLGEYSELTQKGIPVTGRQNFGGAIVTAGGLIFIAATPDKKFRAFDKKTGKLLWETTLPTAGYATPATYSINGKQYIVIASGGGRWAPSGDSYVAFALP